MRLVAQLLVELDREAAPVEVAGEIEEECFESRPAAVGHGGVDSEARHSLESASCCTEAFYRKHPTNRRLRPAQAHVRGGKAETAAAFGAVLDAAGDRVWSPEQARGEREVAGRQRRAYARAGDAGTTRGDRGQHLDREAFAPAGRGEGCDIARAPRAVAEVLADQDPACAAGGVQPALEGLRR